MNTSFHLLEVESWLEDSTQLRAMIAYCTYLFEKNSSYLNPSFLPELPSMSSDNTHNSSNSKSNLERRERRSSSMSVNFLTRRGSLDLRRSKLVESEVKKEMLPKGGESM